MAARRRRVVWAQSARQAVDEALEFIAADSPDAARRLGRRILDAGASLATLSGRGRIVEEVRTPVLRELLVDPYRLIYQVRDTDVFILALLHQARDFEAWRRRQGQ